MYKLTIELVPKTSWYNNVRSLVTPEDWDKLRKACYRKANYRCEICGGKGEAHPVECHEIWHYNDECHEQTLTGLISLCPACHKVKHAGLAFINNQSFTVREQLMKVNGMTDSEAQEYILQSMVQWQKRSQFPWKVNVDWIYEEVF